MDESERQCCIRYVMALLRLIFPCFSRAQCFLFSPHDKNSSCFMFWKTNGCPTEMRRKNVTAGATQQTTNSTNLRIHVAVKLLPWLLSCYGSRLTIRCYGNQQTVPDLQSTETIYRYSRSTANSTVNSTFFTVYSVSTIDLLIVKRTKNAQFTVLLYTNNNFTQDVH